MLCLASVRCAWASSAHASTATNMVRLSQTLLPWLSHPEAAPAPSSLEILRQHPRLQMLQAPGRLFSATSAASDDTQPGIRSVQQHETECWNCQHHMKRGSFACQGCEKIQPVDPSLNYFELLAMPNLQFDMDLRKLERQYKLLQWSLHPDKVIQRPLDDRENAGQQATIINHAYSILRHPLSRANYILSLKGFELAENMEGTIHDKEFLMEVMEARELVDDTDDVQELKDLLANNQQDQSQLVQKLSELFRQEEYASAVPIVTQLTYLTRLEHEIECKLPPA